MEQIEINFVDRDEQKSEYDWIQIYRGDTLVGKARCLINNYQLTINSIVIYPEFQHNGYGKKFVEFAKGKYKRIIADRVRSTSAGFWEKMGFSKMDNADNWIYQNFRRRD